jgi:hypothetical protein
MKHIVWMLAGLLSITLTSCERNDLLLSEDKLNEKIQKSWKVLNGYNTDSQEIWSFSDGTVSVSWSNERGDHTVTGTYSIDARFSNAFVKLNDFSFVVDSLGYTNSSFTATDLNRAWTIVELSNDVLFLSATDNQGNIRSIEYLKN